METYSSTDIKDEGLLKDCGPEASRLIDEKMAKARRYVDENIPVRTDVLGKGKIFWKYYEKPSENLERRIAEREAKEKRVKEYHYWKTYKIRNILPQFIDEYIKKCDEKHSETKPEVLHLLRPTLPQPLRPQDYCCFGHVFDYFYPLSEENKKEIMSVDLTVPAGIVEMTPEGVVYAGTITSFNGAQWNYSKECLLTPMKSQDDDLKKAFSDEKEDWISKHSEILAGYEDTKEVMNPRNIRDYVDEHLEEIIDTGKIRAYVMKHFPLCNLSENNHRSIDVIKDLEVLELKNIGKCFSPEAIKKHGKTLFFRGQIGMLKSIFHPEDDWKCKPVSDEKDEISEPTWAMLFARLKHLIPGGKLPLLDIPFRLYTLDNGTRLVVSVEIGDGENQASLWDAFRLYRQFFMLPHIVRRLFLYEKKSILSLCCSNDWEKSQMRNNKDCFVQVFEPDSYYRELEKDFRRTEEEFRAAEESVASSRWLDRIRSDKDEARRRELCIEEARQVYATRFEGNEAVYVHLKKMKCLGKTLSPEEIFKNNSDVSYSDSKIKISLPELALLTANSTYLTSKGKELRNTYYEEEIKEERKKREKEEERRKNEEEWEAMVRRRNRRRKETERKAVFGILGTITALAVFYILKSILGF